MGNLIELVVAITLAFVLSHLSLLMLLGRHEEVYRGLAKLTDGLGGDESLGWDDNPPPPTAHCARLAYPMYDEGPANVPQATPASNSAWGAPIGWQNPGSADHHQRQAGRQQGAQPQGNRHCFTNNYYLGQ